MSNKTTRRAAASLGGQVMEPPITREAASEYLKADISAEAWSEVCRAFAQYSFTLDNLATSRASKSKDPQKASWHQRQTDTIKALEAALDRLKATRKHDEFLREASENYALATFGRSFGSKESADRMLSDAYKNILHALVIIERAESMDMDVPTEANARATLVRDIADALAQNGIEARASTGWAPGEVTDRAFILSDLTPFEQFLDALGIGEEMTVKSFSEFVRSAISSKTRKRGEVSPL